MLTHHLSSEALHPAWDNALPPALTIAPGDTVVFETLEPSNGHVAREVARSEEAPADIDPALFALVAASARPERPRTPATEMGGHALTGPVAIARAEPGDTLVIEVLQIVPGAWGWTATGPTHGLLKDDFTEWTLHLWDLRAGETALFAPGIRVPLAPFCGVMGVAPAEPGKHSTITPRQAGGNMDIRQLTAGSTLFLPVLVPGALFSVGDVHAAQGDGEVGGTAIETDATVTLRFDLLKGQSPPSPQFRTAGSLSSATGPCFAATGHDPDLYQAARQALRGVVAHLEEEHGLTRPKAVILASVCVDLRISQLVNGETWTVSAFLPLDIFTDSR